MNRVFCILVVLACFAVLSQVAVQAQVIVVDDGTDVYTYDAVIGPDAHPGEGVTPWITIDAGTGGVEIVGATTTFGATIPVVTIDNATGDISGVGSLGAVNITASGTITGVGVDAGTSLIEGTGGLDVTSLDGLHSVVLSNTGTAITGGLSVAGGATITGGMDVTGGIDNNGDGIFDAGAIHGVANGIAAGDAVNVGQLNSRISGLNTSLSSGIASIAALASIPGPVCGKDYSAGLGYGHYNGEDALAVGMKANLPNSNVSLAAGAGFSSNSSPALNLGASLSF